METTEKAFSLIDRQHIELESLRARVAELENGLRDFLFQYDRAPVSADAVRAMRDSEIKARALLERKP